MKIKKYVKIISLFLVSSLLVTTIVIAQEKTATEDKEKKDDPRKGYTEAERPEESYLAKFHAIDVVNKLIKKNLDQIYMLKVIVTNFSDKGWKADYDKVYNGYKYAMDLYYKRDIIYARVKLEENKKDIIELFNKMIIEYKKDTQTMLTECADKVLTLHLDANTRTDPNRNEALYLNQMRLRIAYGQFDDAEEAVINHYYDGAIFHLRVSKSYAISILEQLAKPDERKGVSDKYKVHKADNLNRIFDVSKSGTDTSKDTKEKQ